VQGSWEAFKIWNESYLPNQTCAYTSELHTIQASQYCALQLRFNLEARLVSELIDCFIPRIQRLLIPRITPFHEQSTILERLPCVNLEEVVAEFY
jgi:hypothetical protein